MKSEFNKQDPPFELSAAISGYEEIIKEAYDFPSLSEHLDFMSVMTYDYHGSWENITGHVSPAYYKDGDEFPKYNMVSRKLYMTWNIGIYFRKKIRWHVLCIHLGFHS